MGVFEHFPYTNFQDLNLNWVIGTVKELSEEVKALDYYIKNEIDDYIRKYLLENLDKFILEASYIEETKTIKLEMVEV